MHPGRSSFPVAVVPAGKFRFTTAPDKQDWANHRHNISNPVAEPLHTGSENVLKNN
jgi:hypothetical protein